MDNKNFYEMFAKAQEMINSGNVPKEVQEMAQQISATNGQGGTSNNMSNNINNMANAKSNSNNNSYDNGINSVKSARANYNEGNYNSSNASFNYNEGNNSGAGNSGMNFDIDTMMKVQQMMSALNSKSDDDLSNLLFALKPYLRNEKKEKIDEYIKLIRMGKMAELFGKMQG